MIIGRAKRILARFEDWYCERDRYLDRGVASIDFATPTWQEGVGRLVDFGNTLTEYNRSANPDARAMAQDWGAVGEFLAVALDDRPDCG